LGPPPPRDRYDWTRRKSSERSEPPNADIYNTLTPLLVSSLLAPFFASLIAVESFVAGSIFALATTFILVGSTKIVTVLVTYSDLLVGAPCRLFGGFLFDRAQNKPVTLDFGAGFLKTRIIGPPIPADEEKLWRKGIELDKPSVWEVDWDKIDPSKYPVILASGGVKAVGESSKFARRVTEAVDLFVGRYLVLIATGYLGVKFLHFKIFPDFPF